MYEDQEICPQPEGAQVEKVFEHTVASMLGRSFLAAARGPVSLIDRRHRLVWVNPFRVGQNVCVPRLAIGKTCYGFFMGRRTPCGERCPAKRVFSSGQMVEDTQQITLRDGSEWWGDIRAFPLTDAEGRITHVLKVAFDITEQKVRERKTNEYLEKLEQAVAGFLNEQVQGRSLGSGQPVVDALSAREQEVLALIGQGLTNPEISRVLSISLNTAKTHVSHIYDKLCISGRTQAALEAQKMGLC